MSQPVSPRLQQAVEMVKALSPDEQRQLLEIIRQRLIRYQRAELAAQAAEARQAYQQSRVYRGALIPPYRTETIVSGDGTLTIVGLPFRAGDKVQVVVSDKCEPIDSERHPLRGKPIRYVEPLESVAKHDWEALK